MSQLEPRRGGGAWRRTFPLLCVATLAAPVLPQEPPQPTPAAAEVEARQALASAEARLREAQAGVRPVEVPYPAGKMSGYDPGEVKQASEAVKSELLAHLTTDELAALRAYVEAKYPDTAQDLRLITLRGQTLATTDSTAGAFEKLLGFLGRLKKADSLVVRLKLAVTPGEALVELWPAALPAHLRRYRAGEAPTIYLGLYNYRIAKDGYWDMRGEVNLVDDPGDTLDCRLDPKTGPDRRLPCGLR